MRLLGLIFCFGAASLEPAAAFETAPRAPLIQGSEPLASRQGADPRRPIAAFAINDRLVTLNAYGRRARARLNGDVAGLREARAMGKVFDGARQPALITIELSLKF